MPTSTQQQQQVIARTDADLDPRGIANTYADVDPRGIENTPAEIDPRVVASDWRGAPNSAAQVERAVMAASADKKIGTHLSESRRTAVTSATPRYDYPNANSFDP